MIPALHDRPLREESSSVFSFEGDKITPQQTERRNVLLLLCRSNCLEGVGFHGKKKATFFFTLLYDFIIIYLH